MSRALGLRAWTGRLVLGPDWLRYGVLLVWGATLSLVIWWLVLQDLQQTLSPQAPARQNEVTQHGERLAAVQRGEQRLAAVRAQQAQLSALEAALPAVSEVQSAWAAVHQASRKHGLRMALFKPGPLGLEKPYPQQRAILRLSGSFDDVLGFTRTLAASGAPIALESFSLLSSPLLGESKGHPSSTEGGGNNRLMLDAVLLSLHQPAATPSAAAAAPSLPSLLFSPVPVLVPVAIASATVIPPPSALPGDPFESQRLNVLPATAASALATATDAADAAASARALQSSPLASMRLVGSVQSAGQMTALVMAGGMLHAVRVGDLLGHARGQVAEIRAGDITVREPGGAGAAQPARVVVLSLSKD